jgi:transcriptional regulator with XRE-family HTH domain
MSVVGRRIKAVRKKNGFSQKELGDLLKVSQQTIWKWESGINDPDTASIVKIAEWANVSCDYLLGRVKNPNIAIMDDLPEELKNEGVEALYVLKEALQSGLTADDIQDVLRLAQKMRKKHSQ